MERRRRHRNLVNWLNQGGQHAIHAQSRNGSIALIFAASAAQAQEKISIYHWFEYIPQELLDKFAAETGIEVTMDTFDSNEAMLATLKAGKLGSYDVAVPGDYMVQIMAGEGMLDTHRRGRARQLRQHRAAMGGRALRSGPHALDPLSVGLDQLLGEPGRLCGRHQRHQHHLRPAGGGEGQDQRPGLPGRSHVAGIPPPRHSAMLDRSRAAQALDALLQSAKPHWASFGSDIAKDVLVSGDAAVGMIWNGFSAKARAEGANIEYAYPRQGFVVWMDNVVLLKDAANRASAIKFMDFLHGGRRFARSTTTRAMRRAVEGVARRYLDPELLASPRIRSAACHAARRHLRRGVRPGDAGGLRHHVDPPEEVDVRFLMPGGAPQRGAPLRLNLPRPVG
ncbi:Spermidine/putrescine-binding periplasmic protein 2 [Geodia barretti]|uniref:Spermidine/putrescine-binding periplasmic protein 2 n=1 Tax=Geodia barretti TaxID=519541 RepID=A0AA35R6U9_GEOBA|nr:Spermidine/putrescine-binding periplasmic protein 2 [Geodia barretti]